MFCRGGQNATNHHAPYSLCHSFFTLRDAACTQTIYFSSPKYDASFFNALKWRSIGPARGGRSIACAGSTNRPFEYYFGAVGGGLWKTSDGGVTWRPVTDGQIKSSSVGAVAVSESNPDVVYIGMGETELRGNIMQGDGVYKSTDAGKTWQHAGLSDTQAISRIRIHPTNPDIVYVAALGHPYGPNDEHGVFKSTDGSKSWRRVLFKSSRAGAVDLSLDPNNPQVVFAAIWDVYRYADPKERDTVDEQRVRLDNVLKSDLAQFNKLLAERGLEPVGAGSIRNPGTR